LAVSMAGSVKVLAGTNETEAFKLPEMVDKVLAMLNKSINALLSLDPQLAITVCSLDDEVDNLKYAQKGDISQVIKNGTQNPIYFLDILINGRRLERIADLCTNLAEDVIYITEGKIIRHNSWQDIPVE
jgi:phosphate transport system protein